MALKAIIVQRIDRFLNFIIINDNFWFISTLSFGIYDSSVVSLLNAKLENYCSVHFVYKICVVVEGLLIRIFRIIVIFCLGIIYLNRMK